MALSEQVLRDLADCHGTPLLALDCEQLREQYRQLQDALPGVGLYYAIKAFPNAAAVKTLAACGAGFDVASNGEISLLKQQGVNPRHCIHTHPIKKHSDIKTALRFGCTTFVVDNVTELEKFQAYKSRVGLLLRISYRNPDAVVDLSRKFGCSLEEAPLLLARARALGIQVKGLSFHVGSQCQSAEVQAAALEACAELVAQQRALGHTLSLIDIGGSFPVPYADTVPDIHTYCAPLRAALAALDSDIEVIAEPGRYLVAAAVQGVFSVVGKALRGQRPWYYLDDGVYGSFSGIIYDHAQYPLKAMVLGDPETHIATLAGLTCDSIDVIAEEIRLPVLQPGDLVVGEMMGAYTAASATEFNSLSKAKIVAVNEDVLNDVPHSLVSYLA